VRSRLDVRPDPRPTLSPSVIRQGLEQDMVVEAQKQYEFVKRSGAVANTMIQAKDEKGYLHWKSVQKDDCEKAGITLPN